MGESMHIKRLNTPMDAVVSGDIRRDKLERLLRKILGPYLVILLVLIGIGGWHQIGFHEGFNIGDWLINYQGGFVRRGLVGEFLFLLSRISGINPAILLICLQIFIFSMYFYFTYKVLQRRSSLLRYSILIFSPFIFTFAINSQAGGYRKEILYFAVLAFITYVQEVLPVSKFQKIFLWTLFLYPLVILTDELGVVILPLLLGIYWNRVRPSFSQVPIYLPLILLENSAVFLAVVFNHQVSVVQVNAIVTSLIHEGYDPKGSGAIYALSATTLKNTKDTIHSIFHAKYFLVYPLALLLCSLAYLPFGNEIKKIFRNKVLILGYAGSVIILLPVFVIANDWGRWLYILLVEFFMLILIVDDGNDRSHGIIPREPSKIMLTVGLVFLVCYSIFWYLPHVLEDGADWRSVVHNVPFIRL